MNFSCHSDQVRVVFLLFDTDTYTRMSNLLGITQPGTIPDILFTFIFNLYLCLNSSQDKRAHVCVHAVVLLN